MTAPALAMQKAVYAALVADTATGALIGDRIYDAVPRAATFPYASFGDGTVRDWSTGTEDGAEHRLVLHAWSRERGRRETWTILAALKDALHDAALELEGHALINLRFEFADAALDPDGITWHGVIRFRAVTEPA
jgi:hypothetical protein